MKKKTKLILFVLLGFLIAGVATFAAVSAYWVSNISNPTNKKDDVSIAVGEGKPVTTKIDLTKADLIAYSHGEYFSVDKNPLGKFGYSVMKKKKKKIKNK